MKLEYKTIQQASIERLDEQINTMVSEEVWCVDGSMIPIILTSTIEAPVKRVPI